MENYPLRGENCTDKAFAFAGKLKLFGNRDKSVEYIEGNCSKAVGNVSSKMVF